MGISTPAYRHRLISRDGRQAFFAWKRATAINDETLFQK